MLKACWDCIASSTANREAAGNDEAYGIHLNGDTQRAPPWPTAQYNNENMFILPRILQFGDKIHITGRTARNREKLTVNLLTEVNGSPDQENIACQLYVHFIEDKIYLGVKTNGMLNSIEQEDPPSLTFDESSFDFTFTLRYGNGGQIQVDVKQSYLGEIQLQHKVEQIRFLNVEGDVEKVDKLEFDFA